MARGRLLSTEASVDPELNSLSPLAMLLYVLTLPHLDRDGLIDANPMRLAAVAAPLQPELRDGAGSMINQWVEAGLVLRYDIGRGRACLFFKGFRKHQQGLEYGREPASKYPPPPGWVRTKAGLVPEDPEACFRLAEAFHGKSAYRAALVTAAGADMPDDAGLDPDPDESTDDLADTSRTLREHFAPNQIKEKLNHDDGDDPSLHPTPPVGNSERGYTKLAALFGETSDDELRIGIDALAANYSLPADFNGWTRALAGWHREDLLFVLVTLKTWDDIPDDQLQRINSLPGFLRASIKASPRSWPRLSRAKLDDLAADVDDAVELYALPQREAQEQLATRRQDRMIAAKYGGGGLLGRDWDLTQEED